MFAEAAHITRAEHDPMPVNLSCPNCKKPLRVPSKKIGASVACPGCGVQFAAVWPPQVPLPATPPVVAQPPPPRVGVLPSQIVDAIISEDRASTPAQLPRPAAPRQSRMLEPANWYYARGGNRFGPMPISQLKALAESGHVQPSDLLWSDGMPGWTRADLTPAILPKLPTPVPPQPPALLQAPPTARVAQPQSQQMAPRLVTQQVRRLSGGRRKSKAAIIIGGSLLFVLALSALFFFAGIGLTHDVEDSEIEEKIASKAPMEVYYQHLIDLYDRNVVSADDTYRGKVLQLQGAPIYPGAIEELNTGFLVKLYYDEFGSAIHCYFALSQRDSIAKLYGGMIKGLCVGSYKSGGSRIIVLRGCQVIKKK